jgi:hypothetical protein
MKWLKRGAIIMSVFLLVAQLFRPGLNKNKVHEGPASLTLMYKIPGEVRTIIAASCYDCHSNQTRYPWYAQVQPVGWLLNYHIRAGKEELNLDEFAGYSPRRQKSKLKAMLNQVNDGEMPLTSYKLLHREARLSKSQEATLTRWLNSVIDSLNKN